MEITGYEHVPSAGLVEISNILSELVAEGGPALSEVLEDLECLNAEIKKRG